MLESVTSLWSLSKLVVMSAFGFSIAEKCLHWIFAEFSACLFQNRGIAFLWKHFAMTQFSWPFILTVSFNLLMKFCWCIVVLYWNTILNPNILKKLQRAKFCVCEFYSVEFILKFAQRGVNLVTKASEEEKKNSYTEALRLYEEGVESFLLAIRRTFSFVSEPILVTYCLKSLISHGAFCVICCFHLIL